MPDLTLAMEVAEAPGAYTRLEVSNAMKVLAAEIRRRDGETCEKCREWTLINMDTANGGCDFWGKQTHVAFGCRAWQKREGE